MALLRSAFWLTVAFLVIGPRVDLPGSVNELGSRGAAMAEQAVSEGIEGIACSSIECIGVKVALNSGMRAAQGMARDLGRENPGKENVEYSPEVMQTGDRIVSHPVPRPRLERRNSPMT